MAESSALLGREQISFTRTAELLAVVLGGDTREERLAARVVAHSLIGVQRALVAQVREAVLADEMPDVLTDHLARSVADAFTMLDRGFGAYGV